MSFTLLWSITGTLFPILLIIILVIIPPIIAITKILNQKNKIASLKERIKELENQTKPK